MVSIVLYCRSQLKKKRCSGILSGAEKRRRVLEAGKRFVMKSVRGLSPARLAEKCNKRLIAQNKTEQTINDLETPKLTEAPAAVCGTCLQHHRRKSFFPDGVNPVERMSSEAREVPPEKPPRCFKERDLNVSKNEMPEPVEKRHGKSVRFAERVLQNRRQNMEYQVKEWTQLIESITDDQLMQLMQSIPKQSFTRIVRAATQVACGSCGTKRPLVASDLNSYEAVQDELSQDKVVIKGCSKIVMKGNAKSPYHLRSCKLTDN
uniref:Elongin A binding-protein 1 domain-containing protein n=1 Tax=Syphacia muris TaxID=451379 RepID=A0A0N5ARQ8_9BILA